MIDLRRATVADAKTYYTHIMRHFEESGRDGDIVFHPLGESWRTREMKTYVDRCSESWTKPVTEQGWEAMWLLFEGEKAVGHVFLRSLTTVTSLHRSFLGIGMERHVRGKGWGRKLMEAAIAWAKEQPTLDYIDLYVFAHNTKARELYKSVGFRESEINVDQFRIGTQSIDDVHMVLSLR